MLGLLVTKHVSTTDPIANIFTKPPSKVAFHYFQTKFYISLRHGLWEGIETQLGIQNLNEDNEKHKKDKENYPHKNNFQNSNVDNERYKEVYFHMISGDFVGDKVDSNLTQLRQRII